MAPVSRVQYHRLRGGRAGWRLYAIGPAFLDGGALRGQPRFDSVETNSATPYLVKSIVVDVKDGNVMMDAGQQDEYTMLS